MFNFGDNVDGDKSATKSKVDNFVDGVDFRFCRQCVPALTHQSRWESDAVGLVHLMHLR